MKFLSKLAGFALALVAAAPAMAQSDPLKDMAGYGGGGGYSPVFTSSPVAADGSYTITLSKMFAVNVETSGHKAIRGPFKDGPTGQTIYHYAVPDGAKVCAIRLGPTYLEAWKDINKIDLNKAAACGVASNGAVTLRFVRGEKVCESVNTVVDAGVRFWGAHPEPSDWVVPNKNGSPRTSWCAHPTQVVTIDKHDPSGALRQKLAKLL